GGQRPDQPPGALPLWRELEVLQPFQFIQLIQTRHQSATIRLLHHFAIDLIVARRADARRAQDLIEKFDDAFSPKHFADHVAEVWLNRGPFSRDTKDSQQTSNRFVGAAFVLQKQRKIDLAFQKSSPVKVWGPIVRDPRPAWDGRR